MACSKTEFIYSYYLLAVDKLAWRHPNRQISSNQHSTDSFEEEFLVRSCSEPRSQFSFIIERKSLTYGYYLSHITIQNSNSNQLQHYIQPIEIVRSDLSTKLDGHQTIASDSGILTLDFQATTDTEDQQRLNFTLLCYPESSEKHLFTPNGLRVGSSRPSEYSALSKLISWTKFKLIARRPQVNFYFYEHQCLTSGDQSRSFTFDPKTREVNITEDAFMLSNRTFHLDLIIRHLIDGRILITRRTFNKRIQVSVNTADWKTIDHVMTDLDNVVDKDPKQAIEVVGDLAEILNEISRNSVNCFSSTIHSFV